MIKKQRVQRIIALLLVALMIPAVFAGGAQETTQTTKPSASDKPITLTFWHLWGGSREELMLKEINDFQKLHPNVTIEATYIPSNDLVQKVVQAAGTGSLPDVFNLSSGWGTQMNAEASVENLDPWLKRDGIDLKSLLVDAEYQRSFYNGSVYSLPNVSAGAQGLFFYNKGMMRAAGLDPDKDVPQTFADLQRISKIIVEKLNGSQLDVIAWDPNQMAGQPALQTFTYGIGGNTVSADGKTAMLNSPEVKKVARAFEDYINDVYGAYGGYRGVLEWTSRVSGADTGAGQVQAFINEKQAFYVSGSWTIAQVQSGNPNVELGVVPIPGLNGPQGGTAKHGWSYAMSKTSKNKEMAWEFLKFLTIDPAGNGQFCIEQGRPCPIQSVNEDPSFTALGDLWTNLVKSMNMDVVPAAPDIHMDIVKPWLRDIPTRRIAGESLDSILSDVNKRYQDYLND